MNFDTIIIGGGLSGLVSGISLAKAGKRVAIVSKGQSTLHFHSGSFDLLGYNKEGQEVVSPLDEIGNLDSSHPYSKIEDIKSIVAEAENFFKSIGIKTKGDSKKNHYRITPMGVAKPTWLTLDEYFTTQQADSLPYNKLLLVNIAGFLDFPVEFVSEGLVALGAKVNVKALQIPALQERRMSPSEMRSANIAKILTSPETIDLIAQKVNTSIGDAEAIILPAIFGLSDDRVITSLREKLHKPMFVIATLPPSVPGVRLQTLLCKEFKKVGGEFLLGDTVVEGKIVDNRVAEIKTSNLPGESFKAQNFILATGSFQSHGIVANYEKVYEPVFDLDVDYNPARPEWTQHNVFASQPYMEFGVKTDSQFHALKDGVSVANLYVVGSVLSGHNSVKNSDATGVSIITALATTKSILKQN